MRYTDNISTSDPVSFGNSVNTVLQGALAVSLLYGLWVLLLLIMILSTASLKKTVAPASVVVFIVSFLSWLGGFSSIYHVFFFGILTLIGTIWLYVARD